MPKTQKQYPFKYEVDSDVGSWMAAQKNKSRSIGYLVEWALGKFGPQDLIDASVQEFLNTEYAPTKAVETSSNTLEVNTGKAHQEQSATHQSLAPTPSKSNPPDILANMLK